jgi:hypothetical protein
MKTNLEDIKQLYQNHPIFKRVVDTLIVLIDGKELHETQLPLIVKAVNKRMKERETIPCRKFSSKKKSSC